MHLKMKKNRGGGVYFIMSYFGIKGIWIKLKKKLKKTLHVHVTAGAYGLFWSILDRQVTFFLFSIF